MAFGPDGTMLVSASNDGDARVWDTARPSRQVRLLHTLTRHSGGLWASALSPDGTLLATAGDDLTVRIWDAVTGRHLHTLTGHTRRVWSLAFAPSGRPAGQRAATTAW